MLPKKFIANFISKTKLSDRVWMIDFELINDAKLDFVAGQYLIMDCGGSGKRMYSIASSPTNKSEFSFIANYFPGGIASEYFMKLKKGDGVAFMGALGKFIIQENDKPKTFLVTGTGIAPAWSMINDYLSKKHQPHLKLFWGQKLIKDTFFLNKLTKLETNYNNFEYTLCLSKENNKTNDHTFLGRFTDAINSFNNNLLYDESEFYLCGSGRMVEDTKKFLAEKGVGKDRIFYERFD